MSECEFFLENEFNEKGIAEKLYRICAGRQNVNFIFVGTDSNIGDSLGPLCGEITKCKNPSIMFYGDLKNTITAKDVPYISEYIKKAHPLSYNVVIDAALGKVEDIGMIKVCECGIKPGLAVNKDLPLTGDASIIGVVGERSVSGRLMPQITRLSLVYKMAQIISRGITEYIKLKDNSIEHNYFKNENKIEDSMPLKA